ncbi:hypothetical protein [Sedimenticola hydrogenitrophicus]|uniref:hypothetical protein n=1 Tax=Sedimenticola hydrogenitrophicus TaxID=2967975 RepID=UPI0023AF4B09|nr:hypothetical protein [Sedimenticola hydrogenitrophicus]
MDNRTKLLVLFWLLTICAPTLASELPDTAKTCDLPDNFLIKTDGELSEINRRFLGVHTGKWGGSLPSTLIVDSIDEDGEASGYYSWGTNETVREPGCTPFEGIIEGKKLKFETGSAKLRFKLKDGFIGAAYIRNGNKSVARFNKWN